MRMYEWEYLGLQALGTQVSSKLCVIFGVESVNMGGSGKSY